MIKLWEPYRGPEEIEATMRVIEEGVYARGQQTQAFEQELADTVGKNHALAVANGTCALHLAVRAAGWSAGDKVYTSPLTFIASSNPLIQEGIEPVFGGVGENLQLDSDEAVERVTHDPDIKGLLLPHIFGLKVDTDFLIEIQERRPDIVIVEDAAQALAPADYGIRVGEQGHLVTYSFHENKVVTTLGEGGAITTNDAGMAARIRQERSHGSLTRPDWLDHISLGFNYRISEAQAAFGRAQLRKLPDILQRRAQLAEVYNNKLQHDGAFELPTDGLRSWFGYYIIATNDDAASNILHALTNNNVQYRRNPFPPLNACRDYLIQYSFTMP